MSKKEGNMTFEQLQEKFGFGFAVRVYENQTDPKFFKGLNLDQWVEIAMITNDQTDLNKQAMKKIQSAIKPFQFWAKVERERNIDFWSFENAEFTEFVRKRMYETAYRFWHWLSVFICYNSFSDDEKEEILRQLFKYARNNTKNLKQMYKTAEIALPEGLDPGLNDFREQILEKMIDIAQTFEDWFFIIDNCKDGYRYVDKIMPLIQTPSQWWKAWLKFLYCFDDFRQKAFYKLEELCSSFDDWYQFYCRFARLDKSLRFKVFHYMMNTANSKLEWWITYKVASKFDDFDTYLEVVKKLLEHDLSIEQYAEMWEDASDWDDQEMIIVAIQKRI